ncbi:MAG: RsmD family RNA methyltransferase, partial [Pseudomonadota bacterium]
RDARRPGPGTPHDLVFLDPPYGRGLGEAALPVLHGEGWLAPNATVVWEEGAAPDPPAFLTQVDQRRYGDTIVTFASA